VLVRSHPDGIPATGFTPDNVRHSRGHYFTDPSADAYADHSTPANAHASAALRGAARRRRFDRLRAVVGLGW
jgi:hypothetical protein